MKAKILQSGKIKDVNLGDMDFDTAMDFNLLNILMMSDLNINNLLNQCVLSLIKKLQASGYMVKGLSKDDGHHVIDNIKTILTLYNVATMVLELPPDEQVEYIDNLMKKMEANHVYETICKVSDSGQS